jgi:ABC-type Fe3+/spermidine/putrescine transport system ATPase subunit
MGNLKIQNLSFMHGSSTFSFNGDFAQNRWHILCGSSGSGKTTLLRMLSGLLTPNGGSISVGGIDIGSSPPHLRGVSLMTQANALFPGINVQENLMLALHDDTETKETRKSKILAVTEDLELNASMLRRSTNELSGGQISRFNLARALLRPCSWLLLDEPFAAVDRSTRLAILSRLQKLKQSRQLGIILVSHDLDDILSFADDITVISHGRIVESAPITQALDAPKHKATAKALRSGAIISKSGRDYFLPAQSVHMRPDAVNCDKAHLESYSFANARSIRLGAVTRILDLETDSDFTLPTSHSFEGRIWYNIKHAKELQDHIRD